MLFFAFSEVVIQSQLSSFYLISTKTQNLQVLGYVALSCISPRVGAPCLTGRLTGPAEQQKVQHYEVVLQLDYV